MRWHIDNTLYEYVWMEKSDLVKLSGRMKNEERLLKQNKKRYERLLRSRGGQPLYDPNSADKMSDEARVLQKGFNDNIVKYEKLVAYKNSHQLKFDVIECLSRNFDAATKTTCEGRIDELLEKF